FRSNTIRTRSDIGVPDGCGWYRRPVRVGNALMATHARIDARTQAALARLTDNEKECLRRRLRQQTAKEMALELGVSPHAVEKRLKMARAKLGLSSSLEAARLLASTEEYQRTGPHAADLDNVAPAGKRWP